MMGIRKTLKVNNEDLLTVFYDKLQRRQVLYALTSSGGSGKEQLLEVRYDSLSRPIKFQAAAFDSLEQSYDIFGNLEKWTFGELQESYAYDQAGRLTGIANGNATLMTYSYQDEFNILPHKIALGKFYTLFQSCNFWTNRDFLHESPLKWEKFGKLQCLTEEFSREKYSILEI